jgi:hypothetical protein
MKKSINFSIYGENPKYLEGMLKNIELAKTVYPDWMVYIYYNNTVPLFVLDSYKTHDNVKLIDMSNENLPGMVWRFFPNDSDIFIVRDADSRLFDREKLAVDEWLETDKTLHILRDHPHHGHPILGGMWGLRVRENFDITKSINDYFSGKDHGLFDRMLDMNFLKEEIYQRYQTDSVVHDSVFDIDSHSRPFPSKMEDCKFVGEIFDANDNRSFEYSKWKNREEK